MIKKKSKQEEISKLYIDLKGSLFCIGLFLGISFGLLMIFINPVNWVGFLIVILICIIYVIRFIYMFQDKNNKIKKILGVKKK